MPFTAAQLENIFNSTIDFHANKPNVIRQDKQIRPLYDTITANKKVIPGGKDFITMRCKAGVGGAPVGLTGDDTVSYNDGVAIKTGIFPWKFLHTGIKFGKHELAKNGITISANGDPSDRSGSEMVQLANLIEERLEEMQEGLERGMNTMFWRDGTQDANEIPGITSFIVDVPTTAAAVAGIDPVANAWWQNRANVGFAQGIDPSLLLVTNLLQKEVRQLRRYGGDPDTGICGSAFLEWMEKELRSKGNFTLDGWSKPGSMDMATADIMFKGIKFTYDPTLDDLGKSKYLYLLDSDTIQYNPLAGEEWQAHSPPRPEDKYVYFRGKTLMAGITCNQRNANGVYSIS